jgi:hypothetical protein
MLYMMDGESAKMAATGLQTIQVRVCLLLAYIPFQQEYSMTKQVADPVLESGYCGNYNVPQNAESYKRISCPLVVSVSECKTDMC